MSPLRKNVTGEHQQQAEIPIGLLLADLAGPDPDVRRAAALALGGDPASVPALVAAVQTETDHVVREALCTQLARHDVPEVVDGLIELVSRQDAAVRNAALEVLGSTVQSTALRVPGLLADPDPDVRILIVTMLGQLRHPLTEQWLAQVVSQDPHPNVVSAAIGPLAAKAGAACHPVLHAAAARFPQDPFIAFAVRQSRASGTPEEGPG